VSKEVRASGSQLLYDLSQIALYDRHPLGQLVMLTPAHNHLIEPVQAAVGVTDYSGYSFADAVDAFVGLIDAAALIRQVQIDVVQALLITAARMDSTFPYCSIY
jgi:hypothetical protein